MAVFGSEPEIYFYAQRHSVSGYIYMYDLARDQPYAPAMRQEFMDDVERLKPRFLVWSTWEPPGCLGRKAPNLLLSGLTIIRNQFYDLVGLAEIDQN